MTEPDRLEIIEAAQERCAGDKIVRHAEIRFPAAGEHHRRKMSACRAAAHMDLRGIAAEFSRMLVHPGDRSAALAHDFGERDVRRQRVVHRHHACSGAGEAFGHEAGIGTVEQAPIAAVKKHEDRRRPAGRRGENIETLGLARAIGNCQPAWQPLAHPRAFRRVPRQDRRDVRHRGARVELMVKLGLIVVAVDKAHDRPLKRAVRRTPPSVPT